MTTSPSYFSHPAALVDAGATIGARTRVWAFTHVLPGAVIGEDCNLCDHVFIENDVIIGDRVTIKCGVQVWDGVRLGNDVFIGPNVTFTNDPFPRSRQRPAEFAQTIVEAGASIGANATILPGITIGRGAMIGAGAVVTKSIPAHAIAVGNPARITGYVDSGPEVADAGVKQTPVATGIRCSKVSGVTLHQFPRHGDARGDLTVGDLSNDLPFVPQRYFLIFNVPTKEVRGKHAHFHCHQFLICTHGSVRVLADDGHKREEFALSAPETGLYLPPLTWAEQYSYSEDAVLLVFASHSYDSADYIRDYHDFTRMKTQV